MKRSLAAGEGAYERIYTVVRRIPTGRVATYGEVAALAGLPGHARQVGYALHAVSDADGLPWHRVLNARGEVSPRSEPGMDGLQRQMLESEGVEFNRRGRLDFGRYGWRTARRTHDA
ncbi:MAG: MGMT family protein [Deltaproteobacteria bacterium]|nr:MGMT family protein [Deltaproteobacteria bacterium]MBW2386053.1 MGMT family protein [Deltaproteobacteria bacterium]MBW2698681.1 MGMT family protein [Deltaproteobacteria bacterium]